MNKAFRVVFTIDIVADTPRKAVQYLRDMLNNGENDFIYYIQEHKSRKIHSIDTQYYPYKREILKKRPSTFLQQK